VQKVGLDLEKGEPTAVQEEQPQTMSKAPARQWCQALEKGEPSRITQRNSSKCGAMTTLSIQCPNDRHLYLLRKRGRRLGWPIWPKVRFKSRVQNQWKYRFRMLSRRSSWFAPRTDSCKLSRDTYRFRVLSRRRVIRFRPHYRFKVKVRKKQQQLLRHTPMGLESPLEEETYRVRMLNRGVSEAVSSMHRVQTQCGNTDAANVYASDGVEDDARCIQAVTMQLYQVDMLQESKENLLRNNYGKEAINNELSSALHSTGAQYQMQSQVLEHSNEARGPVNGQQPQPVQTAPSSCIGEKHDTPPPGNYRSLTRRVGAGLKWRDHSGTIGSHACWAGQYNGVRYLLQYVHWQTVRPRLRPIDE